jgi:hypothetical protein
MGQGFGYAKLACMCALTAFSCSPLLHVSLQPPDELPDGAIAAARDPNSALVANEVALASSEEDAERKRKKQLDQQRRLRHEAARGRVEAVQALLDAGAHPGGGDGRDVHLATGLCPLHVAANAAQPHVIELLIRTCSQKYLMRHPYPCVLPAPSLTRPVHPFPPSP